MKVTFDFARSQGRTTVRAEPQEYDAPVFRDVEIFAVPSSTNADRLYVSAALLFHREISGLLDLGSELSCSRHVATQVSRYFHPVDVVVQSQTLKPLGIPSGEHVAALSIALAGLQQPLDFYPQSGELLIRFMTGAVGAVFSESELVLGTNLDQGAGSLDDSCDDVIRLIGASVLFCEEFHLSGLRLPIGWNSTATAGQLDKVAKLLSTVGLGLNFSVGREVKH